MEDLPSDGSIKKQIITENGWTLFSIEQIFDRYKNDKDKLWIDIGIVYQGLGHVLTLRMDIRNGELFMQPDGGSNGYERDMYYHKYIDQVPNKSMYMKTFLYIIFQFFLVNYKRYVSIFTVHGPPLIKSIFYLLLQFKVLPMQKYNF